MIQSESGPFLFTGARTSTVIPFHVTGEFERMLDDHLLVDLSLMPKSVQLDDGILKVTGPISWREAGEFLRSKNRDLMTYPTEVEAFLLSGIATSCTGERAFQFGTLRDQLESCDIIQSDGSLVMLDRKEKVEVDREYLVWCQGFQLFKNAPFPMINSQVDLAIGFEGQLGPIVSASFKTIPYQGTHWVGVPLPHWKEDLSVHMKYFDRRDEIRKFSYCCELLDRVCLQWIDHQGLKDADYLFFEIPECNLERCFSFLEFNEEAISIPEKNFNELRRGIPRGVAEKLSAGRIKKLGTDVQAVDRESFAYLFKTYRSLSDELKGTSLLFGHFGDGHLHFNFLPESTREYVNGEKALAEFYKNLDKSRFSPFAEHGIGLLKSKYMKNWQQDFHKKMWDNLKNRFDPQKKFFSKGFMGQ